MVSPFDSLPNYTYLIRYISQPITEVINDITYLFFKQPSENQFQKRPLYQLQKIKIRIILYVKDSSRK